MEEQHPQPTEHTPRLKILGILNIFYGVGVLLFPMLSFVLMRLSRSPSPYTPTMVAAALFSSDSLFPILLIVAGVGLLRGKTWACVVSIVAAALITAHLVLGFLRFVFTTVTVPSGASEPWLGVLISAILNAILLIYPVALIILLSRRRSD